MKLNIFKTHGGMIFKQNNTCPEKFLTTKSRFQANAFCIYYREASTWNTNVWNILLSQLRMLWTMECEQFARSVKIMFINTYFKTQFAINKHYNNLSTCQETISSQRQFYTAATMLHNCNNVALAVTCAGTIKYATFSRFTAHCTNC